MQGGPDMKERDIDLVRLMKISLNRMLLDSQHLHDETLWTFGE